MSLLNRKDLVRLVLSFLLLSLIVAVPLSFQAISIKVLPFYYDKSFLTAESLIEDGDFNIIDNLPKEYAWVGSGRFNFGGLQDLGAGFAWAPALLISQIQTSLGFNKPSCKLENNMIGFVLGNIIYLLMFFYFSLRIFQILKIEGHLKFSLASVFFGTSLFWNSLIEPIGTILPLTALLTFAVYYLLKTFKEKNSKLNWLICGALFAVAYVVRNDSIYFVLSCFILAFDRKDIKNSMVRVVAILLGWLSIFSVHLWDDFIRTGNLYYKWRIWTLAAKRIQFPKEFFKLFTGPNGSFFISPIGILAVLALVKVVVDLLEKHQKIDERAKILLSLILPVALTAFYNPFNFFEHSLLGGGQFLGQSFFLVLGVVLFLNYSPEPLQKFAKALIIIFIGWNLMWTARFFAERGSFGFNYIPINAEFFSFIWNRLLTEASFVFPEYLQSWFLFFTLWIIPGFLVCAGALILFRKGFLTKRALAFGFIFLFFLTSAINHRNNRANVKALKEKQFFRGKTISKAITLMTYDDFIKGLDKLAEQALVSGWTIRLNQIEANRLKFAQLAGSQSVILKPRWLTITKESYYKPSAIGYPADRNRENLFNCSR